MVAPHPAALPREESLPLVNRNQRIVAASFSKDTPPYPNLPGPAQVGPFFLGPPSRWRGGFSRRAEWAKGQVLSLSAVAQW